MPIPVLVSNECVTEEDIELWKKEVDEYYTKESEKANDGKATAGTIHDYFFNHSDVSITIIH